MEWTPRQYPRVRAVLPVELHRATLAVPLRAQTQDICLGGLYVEMSFTQKVLNGFRNYPLDWGYEDLCHRRGCQQSSVVRQWDQIHPPSR